MSSSDFTGLKAAVFDVVGTLLWKPELVPTIAAVLEGHGVVIAERVIEERHKLLSELTDVPDRTDRDFYRVFNGRLLRALGLAADPTLVDEIFKACDGLPWAPYEDVDELNALELPLAVVSNFDGRLAERLRAHLAVEFTAVLGSEKVGLRKPDVRLFGMVADRLGCQPAELVYVGDSVRLDIEPARGAGLTTVLVDRLDLFAAHRTARLASLRGLRALLSEPPQGR